MTTGKKIAIIAGVIAVIGIVAYVAMRNRDKSDNSDDMTEKKIGAATKVDTSKLAGATVKTGGTISKG
jgi:hypothetical protein